MAASGSFSLGGDQAVVRNRWLDLLKGLGYAVAMDATATALGLAVPGIGRWILAMVWALAALALSGIAMMEERYMLAAGFWLSHVVIFGLLFAGWLALLAVL